MSQQVRVSSMQRTGHFVESEEGYGLFCAPTYYILTTSKLRSVLTFPSSLSNSRSLVPLHDR